MYKDDGFHINWEETLKHTSPAVTRSKSAETNMVNSIAAVVTEAPVNFAEVFAFAMKMAMNFIRNDSSTDLTTDEAEEYFLKALEKQKQDDVKNKINQENMDKQKVTQEPAKNNSDKDLTKVTINAKNKQGKTTSKGMYNKISVVKNDIESTTVSTAATFNKNSNVTQNNSIVAKKRIDLIEDQERADKRNIKPADRERNVTHRPSSNQ